jgi:hypothetical protein
LEIKLKKEEEEEKQKSALSTPGSPQHCEKLNFWVKVI